MLTILFLPNNHMLCWAGRVPAGISPRAFARRIEQEAPRQVQRLARWQRETIGDAYRQESENQAAESQPPNPCEDPAGTKRPSGEMDPLDAPLAENGQAGGEDQGVSREHLRQESTAERQESTAGRQENIAGRQENIAGRQDSAAEGQGNITGRQENTAGQQAEPAGQQEAAARRRRGRPPLSGGDCLDNRAADLPPYFDEDGLDPNGCGPEESVFIGNNVIAMNAVVDVLLGAAMAAGHRPARGGEDLPPSRMGLAQRFIVPPDLALRVDILPGVLLVRADPPLLPCRGGRVPRIPTLTDEERAALALLSQEKSIRAVTKQLHCSRRRIFYLLARARLKIGRQIREHRTGRPA